MLVDESAPSLDWIQTNSTTFERPVDNLESFLQFVGSAGQGRPDKQNWHTTTAIKVETKRENFIDDVKAAWIAMRFQHPCFSAFIENNRWFYHIAEPAELNSWLKETFHVHYGQKTGRQLFPFENNPTKRAFLHVLPNTQELVLHAPHPHVDAIGMVTFLNNMLQYLVSPTPIQLGQEGKNLVPPLSILANVPRSNPSRKGEWDAHVMNFVSQFPTVRVANENKGAPAAKSSIQWLTFSEEDTMKIRTKSKELGFTVTAAAQAAASRAARVHGQVTNTTHSTLAIYDARGYIDNNLYPHSSLVGPYMLALPAVFPIIPDSFTETAKAAREVFLHLKENDYLRQWHPIYAVEFPKVLSTPMPPEIPPAADLLLSSAGILDKYMAHAYRGSQPEITVTDLWVALELLGPDIGLEMWTFGGKLVMEFIYNEAFHRHESVHLLLQMVQEQLVQGLGVDLKFDARSPGDEGFAKGRKDSGVGLGSP